MAGNNNYFVRPMKQLMEAMEAGKVQMPAPGDEAESAAQSPIEEPVSYTFILERIPALIEMRSA